MKEEKFLFETSILCEDLSGIFEAFIEAFKEGKVDLNNNDRCLTLIPPKGILLKIEADQKTEEISDSTTIEDVKLCISLSWKKEKNIQ